MALAETANLVVKLSLAGNFNRQLTTAQRGLGRLDAALSKTEGRAYRAGQQIGTGIRNAAKIAAVGVGLLASQVAIGLNSLVKLEQAQAQTNAVIKSTKGVAGVTADEIGRLSEKFEGLNATVGDEVIRSGANLLLTYTNIREKAFEPTLEAALNLNTALGKGPDQLTGTVRILGKALNDPKKGLSALSRVGITFSKEQAKRITKLQKEGKLYEAQGLILKELEKRFGGSFLAQGNTTAGKVAKFTDSIEDLQRALATALLPAVGNIADALTELLSDPEVIKGAEQLGRDIGRIFSKDNIKEGARLVGQVFDTLRKSAPAIKAALSGVGTVLKGAFDAFTSLPPEVQQLLIGGFAVNKLTGGLVTNIAGGVFGALKAMTVQAGVVNVTGGIVNGGGGLPGGAGGAKGAVGGLALLGGAVGVAAIGAAISTAIADATNADFGRSGSKTNFQAPGGGPFGIGSALANLGELKRLLERPPTAKLSKETNTILAKVALSNQRNGERNVESQSQNQQKLKQAVAESKRETSRGLTQVKATTKTGLSETERETSRGTQIVGSSVRSGTSQVVGAIARNRPVVTTIVNVSATHVSKTVNVTKRYGNTDSRSSGYAQGLGQFGG